MLSSISSFGSLVIFFSGMSLIQYVTFRIMLPQQATVMTISASGYTAATTKTSAEEKRKVFTAANGQLDIDQPLLLFPCCIQ